MSHACWSILIVALGGVVGSFLNVVIYRWPRDLSILRPARSFCPACKGPIAWRDNIPILSYLLLCGRCRRCHASISLQYPLVELATVWTFLMTYDAFFVARQRLGIGDDPARDWPMLAAHWALWAGLIAMAVMDLEAYLVDIRVTRFIAVVGVVAHALWTPPASMGAPDGWLRPGAVQSALAAGAVIGLLISKFLFLRGPLESAPSEPPPVEEPPAAGPATLPADAAGGSPWLRLIVPLALAAAYLAAMLLMDEQRPLSAWATILPLGLPADAPPADPGTIRLTAGLAFLLLMLALAAGQPHAEADSRIVQEIEDEAVDSQHNVLWELKLLTPAILLGLAAVLLMRQASLQGQVLAGLRWTPTGQWRPAWGLATGLSGWVIAGAIAWLARIAFTVLLRKEALGMGDVHIMAAAGAVAGWPVALLGFFLAAPLALVGLVVIHLRRQSRALPYGPWLALGFLLACVFQDRILWALGIRWMFD